MARNYHQHIHQKMNREKIFIAYARQTANFLNIHEICCKSVREINTNKIADNSTTHSKGHSFLKYIARIIKLYKITQQFCHHIDKKRGERKPIVVHNNDKNMEKIWHNCKNISSS